MNPDQKQLDELLSKLEMAIACNASNRWARINRLRLEIEYLRDKIANQTGEGEK